MGVCECGCVSVCGVVVDVGMSGDVYLCVRGV